MKATHIQFGCGGNHIPEFANHDIDIDLTKPIPYDSGCAQVIVIEHCLEHFDSREVLAILDEIYRILMPGGLLRVCCPAVGPWLLREHARDLATGHGHKVLLTEDTMRTFLWLAGFTYGAIRRSDRHPFWDNHHRVIGIGKDNTETCRMEAIK